MEHYLEDTISPAQTSRLVSCINTVTTATTPLVAGRLGSSHPELHFILSIVIVQWMEGENVTGPLFVIAIIILSLVRGLGMLLTWCRARGETSSVHTGPETTAKKHQEILGPLLFPSRTTHRRLHPTQHSFGYSYLLAGVPVHNQSMYCNDLLSSHVSGHSDLSVRQAWFSIHSEDYLQRGSAFAEISLRGKLEQFLDSEGAPSSAFPYAYLVTAPRVLGWSFNPVSFWYLYNSNRALAAMILEVNNTFDERRMYLLQTDSTCSNKTDSKLGLDTMKFTAKWKKDFHVSPFNDRAGTYSVTATDIVATRMVDVTITLSDMDEKPKIVARIHSLASGIEPTSTSSRTAQLSFLVRQGWKGFLTNPRILRQAWTLWRKRLMVYFRPEPLSSSIGRTETLDEAVVEKHFFNMLQMLSDESGINVDYTSAAGATRGKVVHKVTEHTSIEGGDLGAGDPAPEPLQLRILSPQFYTELALANGSVLDVFEHFCLSSKEGEVLAWTSDPRALQRLLEASSRLYDIGTHESMRSFRQALSIKIFRSVARYGFFRALIQLFSECVNGTLAANVVSGFDVATSKYTKLTRSMHGQDPVKSPSHQDLANSVETIVRTECLAFGSETLLDLEKKLCRMVLTVALTGVGVSIASLC